MTLALLYLNKRIEDTDNEKLSVVTALKILNEEQHRISRGHSSPDILDEPELSSIKKTKTSRINITESSGLQIASNVINLEDKLGSKASHAHGLKTSNRFQVLSEISEENNDEQRGHRGRENPTTTVMGDSTQTNDLNNDE